MLLGRLASPPVVITNPDLIKYLIFQLLVEAIFVMTFAILGGIVLYEEWKHAVRWWRRRYGDNRSGRAIGSRTMKVTAARGFSSR